MLVLLLLQKVKDEWSQNLLKLLEDAKEKKNLIPLLNKFEIDHSCLHD